jgi:tight adherence protein B
MIRDVQPRETTVCRREEAGSSFSDRGIAMQAVRGLSDWKEIVFWSGATGAAAYAVGIVFYNDPLWAAALLPSVAAVPPLYRRHRRARRKVLLIDQFQQALHVLSAAVAAGKSLESAMAETVHDLAQLYPDPNAPINREWRAIVQRTANGVPTEQAFADWAHRSGVEDIRNFAEVLAIAKRQGGNLVDVIRRTVQVMSEKIDTQREIRILLARKRWESRLLCAAPLVFVAMLRLSSPDYMAPLYQGAGRLIMTAALAAIAGCVWAVHRLMAIEV